VSNQDYSRSKGRRKSATFTMLRHDVMDSPNYRALSPRAVKLLLDIARQYNRFNNGDLCATYKVMKPRGWTSKDQLQKGLDELEHYGFILMSRQGGKHKCNLYALTWLEIDECKGKHELRVSKTPLNNWNVVQKPYSQKSQSLPRHTGKVDPQHGSFKQLQVVPLPRHTGQPGAK